VFINNGVGPGNLGSSDVMTGPGSSYPLNSKNIPYFLGVMDQR
jgi:hypothetical protein